MLAIIPACEGGTLLPNKNIRIVNGKPLIYYIIRTAKASKYISDILVTTNSMEVIQIAKSMGVRVLRRDESLCSGKVSVDAVIYHAVKHIGKTYDDVVSLQSISPVLKTETLDRAIQRYYESDCDTLVSVVDRPFFFWKRENGTPVALREQRGNRHELPPFYQETGSFLITKWNCIRPENRIGENVELFELSEEEGLTVTTFGDLKQAEHSLNCRKIAFFVNGNREIGLGHISRVLQLTDEFFSKPDIYYDTNRTDGKSFGNTKHHICPVNGVEGFLSAVQQESYDVIINDILSTSEQYMHLLKDAAPQAGIINFEDEGTGAELADCVINALYEKSSLPNAYVGSEYYIVPKQFLVCNPIEIREHVKKVIITFGGADPNDYTDQVLRLISTPEFSDFEFLVVLGKEKKNIETLMAYGQNSNIQVFHNIDNMADVMSQCDAAITSRGRTGFELAVMGIPTISIAQNEREEMHDFMSEENGYCYLGYRPGEEVIYQALHCLFFSDETERNQMQKKMLLKDLRNGRNHVMSLIRDITESRR